MQVLETRFARALADKIDKTYQTKAQDVTNGISSFDKYREEVGYLRGLKDALKMIEETRAELLRDR